MIMSGDVILAISFSGQTEEINKILPSLARRKLTIISMTGHENSKLALMSDIHIKIYIDREGYRYRLVKPAPITWLPPPPPPPPWPWATRWLCA